MIVGQFPPMDSDDESSAERGHVTDDDDHNVTMSDEESGGNHDNDSSPSESAAFLRPLFWRSPTNLHHSDSTTEDDVTFRAEPDMAFRAEGMTSHRIYLLFVSHFTG